jgi:hypothetical protein
MSSKNDSEGKVRPGLKSGRSNEFTIITTLKPGGAERLRQKLSTPRSGDDRRLTIGTLHEMRYVIFDNDTRLLFASTFDGDWDAYIDDFGSMVPDLLDNIFEETEGYPGIRSPDIKDFIVKHQISAFNFFRAYPDASVRDVLKALKIKHAFDVLLDTATS